MGVGIPGTGMIGLPIAIALGALIGKSEYQLEVLKECTHEAVKRGKKMIDQHFSKRKYSRKTLYRSLLSDISESFYRNNCRGTYSFYLHIQK